MRCNQPCINSLYPSLVECWKYMQEKMEPGWEGSEEVFTNEIIWVNDSSDRRVLSKRPFNYYSLPLAHKRILSGQKEHFTAVELKGWVWGQGPGPHRMQWTARKASLWLSLRCLLMWNLGPCPLMAGRLSWVFSLCRWLSDPWVPIPLFFNGTCSGRDI